MSPEYQGWHRPAELPPFVVLACALKILMRNGEWRQNIARASNWNTDVLMIVCLRSIECRKLKSKPVCEGCFLSAFKMRFCEDSEATLVKETLEQRGKCLQHCLALANSPSPSSLQVKVPQYPLLCLPRKVGIVRYKSSVGATMILYFHLCFTNKPAL